MQKTYLLLLLLLIFKQGCKPVSDGNKDKQTSFAKDDVPEITDTLRNVKIVWDKQEKIISHDIYFSEYGRIRRIAGDTLLLIYHCGTKGNEWDNIALRKSLNNGKSWLPAKIIAADHYPKRYYGFSTPDLLVLANKQLLMSYTGRGIPDDTLHNNLQVRTSNDQGVTWSPPRIVATGRSWEPGLVQLPDGEIELFYANEFISSKRAKGRHEQKILMTTSKDNGLNWSSSKTVAFRKNTRDGMPVPVILKDNKGIVLMIEAVEGNQSPDVIWSSVKARWNYRTTGSSENHRRWTASVDPVWGGAPGLVQLATGETILCMQTEGGRKIDRYKNWKKNTVVVMVGNSVVKNFGQLTFPYPDLPVNEGRYFNSLFLKDERTIVLVTTRNLPSGRSVIYWKEGHLYRPDQ